MSEGAQYRNDALAIVGVAFRLPGGLTTMDDLWLTLSTGRNLITDLPPERFDAERFLDHDVSRPGKSYTFAGGYIGDVTGFDSDYFGISRREATLMDPKQRLLLEMTAEAFDDAGIDPASVSGSDAAVFVGMSDMEYLALQMISPDTITAHTMSGGALSIASNRLSHVFDLRGPSMTIDTACSSVMVALHQACETVLRGQCGLAVVGGIHLLLSPYSFIGFAKATMLSPSGRCATFSAEADGYVRGEGGGVLLVKRLSDALAAGDRIHAVILATHINTDGRTSGMAVPSVDVQESLLREVYRRAQVQADDLVYFEAHGTGTPVGDPIECEAIGRALGRLRSTGHPLPIGSVKTNLGHMEPASGISGILKAILVLQHRSIPPSLHGRPPNPLIDFAALGLAPVHENLPVDGRPAVVGVNSFGFGGANAHAVLAEAPDARPREQPRTGELPVVVSARSREALGEASARLAQRLSASHQDDFYDMCYTAARRRARHPHQAVVFAATAGAAAEQLVAADHGEPTAAASGVVATGPGRVVFVFSGNGSHWPRMGADLVDSEPAFRAAVEAVDRILLPRLGWSVLAEMAAPPERSRLQDTAFAQPALFALQIGLVALLADQGIHPAAVIGHSVGEVAAALVAGSLDLEAACRVIAGRSQTQALTAGQGRMAAVGLSRPQAEQALAAFSGRLEVAAVNSSRDVTISGEQAAMAELRSQLEATVFFRELDLDYPFHSRAMDAIEEPLRAALSGLRSTPATVPFASTVTGGRICGTELDASYWWSNVRKPVLFEHAAICLLAEGFDVFLEIGPHPVLTGYLRRIAAANGTTAVVPTLGRGADGPAAIRTASAALVAAGVPIDYGRYFPHPGRVVDLPAYPWQRERHWHGKPGLWIRSSGDGTIDHPMLGERLPLLEPTWMGTIEPALLPWLADHKVLGTVLMPIVGYVEMAMAAGGRMYNSPVEIKDLAIPAPLPLPWGGATVVRVQTSVSQDDGAIRIASSTGSSGEWRLHAQGRVRRLVCDAPTPIDVAALQAGATEHWQAGDIYGLLERAGLGYGPEFQVLREAFVGRGQVLARYASDIDQRRYQAHPAILDGALQAGAPLLVEGRPYLPGGIDRTRLWRQPAPTGIVHVRQISQTSREACWDIRVADDDGTVVAELQGCRMRRVGGDQARPPRSVTVLRAQAHTDQPGAPSPLPPPHDLAAAAQARIEDLVTQWHHQGYEEFESAAKAAASHYTMAAINDILAGQTEFTTQDMLAAGMLPKYTRWWQLATSLCERHGLLKRKGNGICQATGKTVRMDVWGKLLSDHPRYSAEALIFGRFGQHFADILCGRRSPIEIMFGDSGPDTLEHFYDTGSLCRPANQLALSLIEAMIAIWPSDRPLRVLEVGAGTGGTTAALLPVLPPERTEYLFTDVSAAFITSAETRFQTFDFVQYRCLDIDEDLQQQGLAARTFDLIVASNVLHVARDLRSCLRRLRNLLVPGGQLLAIEPHDPELLIGFGLSDQFWSFTDTDLRSDSLLPRDHWPPVLRQCGFDDVVQVGDDREPARSDLSVILARRHEGPTTPAVLPPAEPGASWILVVEDPADRGVASAIARALSTAGGRSVVSTLDCDDDRWAERIHLGASIVFVLGGGHEMHGDAAIARAERRFGLLRAFSKACQTFPPNHGTRLWLVTRPSGALPEPEKPLEPGDAALWGAARSLANERTDGAVMRISWERGEDTALDVRRLARELLAPSAEDEIVLTGAGRFVPRQVERDRPRRMVGRHQRGYELELRHQGVSYEFGWVEAPPLSPAADEVVIKVRAAALNYHDVMLATGMLPPDAEDPVLDGPQRVGLECAGEVIAVGKEVRGFRAGDRVCGAAPRSLASHAVAKANLLAIVPEDMDFAAAATLPLVYLTVHHSLEHLARLAPGETVLVHGAAGGVGLAAIQYAQLVGAHVIATAGTPAKRDLLSMLGVKHVFDSRTLTFAEQIMSLTGGVGVDVVLNSLSGEAIPRGLELLRPHGRFVELGKRDVYANSRIMLRAFRNNISLFCVDVSQLPITDPRLTRSELQAIEGRIHAREYRPLLHRAYPASRIAEAFRLMQQSRHIGKVVVTFDDPVPVEYSPEPVVLDSHATYLVTGGLSGLGAAVARDLGQRGARHLALVGRRGIGSPESGGLIESLARQGVQATVYAADVADPAAMAAIMAAIDDTGHTLRGVLHAAMQLDDGTVDELGDARFRTALRPKMEGGMLLDTLTCDWPLDFFLVFSSMAALVGNFRQANYCAGNLFLEALVRARRRRGLPAVAISWAGIGEVGYVARNGMGELLAGLGIHLLSPDQALHAMGEVLGLPDDVVCVGGIDWGRMSTLIPLVNTPRLSGFLPPQIEGTEYRRDEFVAILSASTPDDARRLVENSLALIIAGILHSPPDRIDRTRRLDQMGMDSLMMVEMVSCASEQFQCEIPLMEVLSSASIGGIAELVLVRLGLHHGETTSANKGVIGYPPPATATR